MTTLQKIWHRLPVAGTAALGAATLLATGCQSVKGPSALFSSKEPTPILAPRSNVPSPYIRPADQLPAAPPAFRSESAQQQGYSSPEPSAPAPQYVPIVEQKRGTPLEQITAIQLTTAVPPPVVSAPAPQPTLDRAPEFEIQPLPMAVAMNVAVPAAPPRMLGVPADITDVSPLLPPAVTAVPALVRQPIEAIPEIEPLPEVSFGKGLTHTVTKGDSLWKIGQKYGVTVNEIAAFNGMDQNKSLHPKTVLRLPPGATLVPAQQSSAPPKASSKSRLPSASMATLTMTPKAKKPIPNNGTYTVQKGDSLWKISRLFGVSVKNLQTYNGLNSTSLAVGQPLSLRPSGQLKRRSQAATQQPAREQVATRKTPRQLSTAAQRKPVATPVVKPTTRKGSPPAEILTLSANGGLAASGAAPASKVQESTPAVKPLVAAKAIAEAPKVPEAPPFKLPHTITQQDTLPEIAEMYDSHVEWIRSANPTLPKNDNLEGLIGKKIAVPVHSLHK